MVTTVKSTKEKGSKKPRNGGVKETSDDVNSQIRDNDGHISRLLKTLVEKEKSLFDNNSSLIPEIDLTSLDVPTLSPSDQTELKGKILKMSKLKKEYEIDEMMKQIEKNERNLKRVNISISLSKENNANFEKKAEATKAQLDNLVKKARVTGLADDSNMILKIQKLFDDLDKIEERTKKYTKLLEKQQGLIVATLALHHNLTFFENVIQNNN